MNQSRQPQPFAIERTSDWFQTTMLQHAEGVERLALDRLTDSAEGEPSLFTPSPRNDTKQERDEYPLVLNPKQLRFEVVQVPDLSAAKLLKLAVQRCHVVSVHGVFKEWNFYRRCQREEVISGRGLEFEFLTWQPRHRLSDDDVRTYFRDRGFYGHTGAFLTWLAETAPTSGTYATLPEEADGWRMCDRPGTGCAVPLMYALDLPGSSLTVRQTGESWSNVTLIGFRELRNIA